MTGPTPDLATDPSRHQTPPWGYPDDPNDTCTECGAPGGIACRTDCPTGGPPIDLPPLLPRN